MAGFYDVLGQLDTEDSSEVTPFKSVVGKKKVRFNIPSSPPPRRELYRVASNGNVYNTHGFYVIDSGLAHAHQVQKLFEDAVEKARIYLERDALDCDVKVNLVVNRDGSYLGYGYVDLHGEDSTAVYWLILGHTADGKERMEQIEDPNWEPGTASPRFEYVEDPDWVPQVKTSPTENWGDQIDSELGESRPKIVKYLPPLIKVPLSPLVELDSYPYDGLQLEKDPGNVSGTIKISPAYITPGATPDRHDKVLFVKHVPVDSKKFIESIFGRYARSPSDDRYPKIDIRRTFLTKQDDKHPYFALITYSNSYDAAFALQMLRKVNINFDGTIVTMITEYAKKKK